MEDGVMVWAAINPTGDAALVLLLEKIEQAEDLVSRMQLYILHGEHELSKGVVSYLMDWIARKQDQIDYERHRIYQIGLAIASGRDVDSLDI